VIEKYHSQIPAFYIQFIRFLDGIFREYEFEQATKKIQKKT